MDISSHILSWLQKKKNLYSKLKLVMYRLIIRITIWKFYTASPAGQNPSKTDLKEYQQTTDLKPCPSILKENHESWIEGGTALIFM